MNPKNKSEKGRKRRRNLTALANRVIDDSLHPMTKENSWFILVDSLAHAVAEGDLKTSAVKFTRYTLPILVKRILEKT